MTSPIRGARGKAVVIGAGLAGLTVALELLDRGWRVSVFDRAEPGGGASSAAAGMLCPFAESIESEAGRALSAFGAYSLALWPALAARMAKDASLDPDFSPSGSWVLARDSEAAARLAKLAAEAPEAAQARLISADAARSIEPGLGPVEVVLSLPTEAGVDPERACAALARLVRRADGVIQTRATIIDIEPAWTPSVVVEQDGRRERMTANVVVVAAGWRAAAFARWPAMRALRPVKGEAAMFAAGDGPQPARVIRERDVYLKPRSDGRLIVGATAIPGRCDRAVDPAAIERLAAMADRVFPGLARRTIERSWAGVRPGGVDGLPVIGRLDDGVWAACGLHRNGVLLAPGAARALADEIEAGEASGDAPLASRAWPTFAPDRFTLSAPIDAEVEAEGRAVAETEALTPN